MRSLAIASALVLAALSLLTAPGCGRPELRAEDAGGEASLPSDPARGEGPAPDLEPSELIAIPAGIHRPLYPGKDEPEELAIEAFLLERQAVTNEQFLAFVWANP